MELNDLSSMPFGKHRGKLLQDVPASYFHYLWTQEDFKKSSPDLWKYIKDNLHALKQEYTDGIW